MPNARSSTTKAAAEPKAKAKKAPPPPPAADGEPKWPERPDLADPAVRAEMREKNLEVLQRKAPGLYASVARHAPQSTLVVDDSGQPDVEFQGSHFYERDHDEFIAKQLESFWEMPRRMKLAPLEPAHFDDIAGIVIHEFLAESTNAGLTFNVGPSSDKSYYLYVLGLGLGGHLPELVERTGCKALAIVDPNPELLYHSVEVFDWATLFDIVDSREGLLSIFINNNPHTLSLELREWLRSTNPMSVDGSTCYFHYNNPVFNAAIDKLTEDRDLILSGLGFFFDETLMIKNTHHNLYSGEERVYVRPKADQRLDAPAFVIGNGPSLDADLEFLRENQDKAIVVSSGTALRPLVLNGIMPDFQIETENIDVLPVIDQVAKDHDISKIHLVTSTSVDIDVPPYFDSVLYYFRGSLSPYPIFCDSDARILKNPNPTVVNASLSFVQELGFRQFYFFGTDMGTTMGQDKHHSKDAYQYTEGAILRHQVYNIPVPANLGGTCMASDAMYWVRDAAEKAIRQYFPGRSYFNCSNGAKIEGALPMPSKLLELPDLPDSKQPVIDKILDAFPVYDRKEFDDHWNDDEMQKILNDWLDRFVEMTTERSNFDDLTYLTKLMSLLRPAAGLTAEDWGAALVYRGTCFQAMMAFEYYARRLPEKDIRTFEKFARKAIDAMVAEFRDRTKTEFGSLSKDAAERLQAKN